MSNDWVYIPVELKVRELQSKLLLALKAMQSGFNVIIGNKNGLIRRLPLLPRGIFLGFGFVKNYAKLFSRLRRLGHRVVAFDEEGLVFLNEQVYKKFRISAEALDNIDLLFTWGAVQTEVILSKIPKIKNKIVNTGSLRFDLMRPEYIVVFKDEINKLKEEYGPFILVNSSFAPCNHFSGTDFYINSLRGKSMIIDYQDEIFHRERISHMKKVFDGFIKMIPKISAEFPDYNIIIRPHPSENHEVWRGIIKDLHNVFMIHEGDVIPWIAASEMVIQNGCTTGVEARFLNKPVIAYRPVVSDKYDIPLPNSLGENIFNVSELITYIGNLLSGTSSGSDATSDKKYKYILESNISCTKGKFASEIMVKNFYNVKVARRRIDWLLGNSIYLKILDLSLLLKDAAVFIFKGKKMFDSYQKHKFSGLNESELIKLINRMQTITGKAQIRVKVTSIGDYCFKMTGKSIVK
jgi:surface carbohydrate biosynthesis protein